MNQKMIRFPLKLQKFNKFKFLIEALSEREKKIPFKLLLI